MSRRANEDNPLRETPAARDESSSRSVIIIGGGIIGTACAYYLSKAGWQVTILDRGGFGQGCSHANCGFVCPSHVLPLAEPGAAWRAFKSLFKSNSPFHIQPRFNLSLWRWLWHFARRCNERDMLAAGRAIQPLLEVSRRLYDELFREESLDSEWQTVGLLFVFQTPAALEHYAETVNLQRQHFGLDAQHLDGSAVVEREPALKPGLAGGWLYPGDAHLRPDRLLAEWRRLLEVRGVRVIEHCEVTSILREGNKARAAVTVGSQYSADAFVFATGAWTPLLERELGCRIPIQPGKGYSLTMPRPVRCPNYPLIFEEHRVAVTPMRTGYRLGSTMEFAGYDTTISPRRLNLLRAGACHYLHDPICEPVVEEWYGWRPMTWDSVPIIDRSPAYSNIVIAAGHNMLGLSMAPATGKAVSELLSESPATLEMSPYRLTRF
jgi:D-amino-acid dehydrogenase